MSQHDYNIANQGFPATRADLNNALAALASTSSGVAAPTTTYANQFWYDTTNNLLMFRNADNDAWVTFAYLDQATDEWEIRTAVIQAVDAAGLTFKTDEGTARVTIDDTGNVGIGTSSPTQKLEISDALDATIRLTSTDNKAVFTPNVDTYGTIEFYSNDASAGGAGIKSAIRSYVANTAGGQSALAFSTSSNSLNDVEAMRLDASGTLLLGKAAADVTTIGVELLSTGKLNLRVDEGPALDIRRATGSTNELFAIFRDDNAGMIKIGNSGNAGYIEGATGDAGLKFEGAHIRPRDNQTDADNAVDLGSGVYRFDDVYATNGTINTSDRNQKQDIDVLSDAEQRVAVTAKGLMRKFRWRDAVEAKGDDARTHFGIIAQDLQAAFAAEGLDAGDYAMFISTTWWETQTEVPAVEAVAEVLDDDGNVVTEAVDAVDAYTRTDTYETQEEAPEGATERTRLGVRYSELLAFIIAAI